MDLQKTKTCFTPNDEKQIKKAKAITLRETNRKGKRVQGAFNNDLMNRFPLASGRPPSKTFQSFTEAEMLTFIGIPISAGVHRQNKENLDDMWKSDALPLIRAAMSHDRFKMMLRYIRFDTENTCAERTQTDNAAPIQDIWIVLQRWSPRGHILKSLALASKPQVLENWPVLGSKTALFFELLQFCGAPENFFGTCFILEIT